MTRAKTISRWLTVLLIVELLLMAIFVYGYYRWSIEYRLNGLAVPAEVIARRETPDDNAYLTYRFEANGAFYEHERRVTRSTYEQTQIGDTVSVVYSPIDVQVSGIGGEGGSDFDLPNVPGTIFTLRFLIFVLPALIFVNGVLLLILLIARRRVHKFEQI